MIKKLFVLMVIIFSVVVCDLEAAQIDSSWVGGSEEDTSWERSSNWEPNIVPDNNATNTFAVTIDAGGGYVRVVLTQWHTIDQLDCYGEVELGNWTSDWVELILVDANGLTNHGYLVIEGLAINGDVTNSAGAMLELEDMGIEGNLYNPAGATVEVIYEVCIDEVENSGTIIVVASSSLGGDGSTSHNTGQINIYGGSYNTDNILDNNSTGTMQGFGVIHAGQLLRNKGQIYAYGGSLAVLSEGPLLNTGVLGNNPLSSLHIKPGEDVNNHGTIEVNAGGGVAFDCNLINEPNNLLSEPNGVIKLLGGNLAATTITQKTGAVFEGFGGITGDVLIDPDGLIKLTGPTNIIGNVTVSAGATLQISDGQTLITGQTVNNGSIELIGGTVIFQGGYSGAGTIPVTAGTDRNHFDVNADGIEDFKDFTSFADNWLWQASWY
jgi:hypothetical protein